MKKSYKNCQAGFQVEKITNKNAINFMFTGNAIKNHLIDEQIKKVTLHKMN